MANLFSNISKNVVCVSYQQMRFLPRWAHRRPVKVILPTEYDSEKDAPIKSISEKLNTPLANADVKKVKSKDHIKTNKVNFMKHSQPVKPLTIASKMSQSKKIQSKTVDMLETVIDKEGNFIYTKMKDNDIRIAKIMSEVKSNKEKSKNDLMLLEGTRLIIEGLQAGCILKYVLFSRMKEVEILRPFLPKLGAQMYKMPYKEMQVWSDLTTTPGIMAIFKTPDSEAIAPKNALPLTIICDNIREPDNLGAILRTCSGVGCSNLILTKGCVHLWHTKVLRSSAGAHFRIQIAHHLDWPDIRQKLPENSAIFIADNNAIKAKSTNPDSLSALVNNVPVLPYFSVNFPSAKHIVLIIGGETEGISEESYQIAGDLGGARLNVPLNNGLDSLNVGTALGIIAFEIKRQLLKNNSSKTEDIAEKVKL